MVTGPVWEAVVETSRYPTDIGTITPRYTADEVRDAVAPLTHRIAEREEEFARPRGNTAPPS